jgi:hypothetical protein
VEMSVKNYEHLTHPRDKLYNRTNSSQKSPICIFRKRKRVMGRNEVGELKLVGAGVVFKVTRLLLWSFTMVNIQLYFWGF